MPALTGLRQIFDSRNFRWFVNIVLILLLIIVFVLVRAFKRLDFSDVEVIKETVQKEGYLAALIELFKWAFYISRKPSVHQELEELQRRVRELKIAARYNELINEVTSEFMRDLEEDVPVKRLLRKN